MSMELNWGLPVIAYLFLAGVGAGALTVSASILLRGGGGHFGGSHFDMARYGALIAPLPVMIGSGLLILELGSFHAGHWFKFLNLYTVINLSPMSIGTWLLTAFIGLSLVYAYTFLATDGAPGDRWDALRRSCAWLGVPMGISVAVYTGVLLGAMPSRPFWNSPVLALIFLFSALSTGVAAIMLTRTLFRKFQIRRLEAVSASSSTRRTSDLDVEGQYHQSGYILAASDTLLIGLELTAIFLFLIFAYLTVGDVRYAVSVILFGGSLAGTFWFWVIFLGLVLPALVELYYVTQRLLLHQSFAVPLGIEIVVPTIVLAGGFMLRYVVVVAGQITGPVGI